METYRAAGVDYDVLDPAKRDALSAALSTAPLMRALGGESIDRSRGASAFLFSVGRITLGAVLECLGTKSLIASQYQEETGVDRWADTGYDAVSAIVNDLCSVGALPLVIHAYFAAGGSGWYEVPGRQESLIEGWRRACEVSGATWGGGESPSLSGLVADGEIELAGSSVGRIPEGKVPILGDELSAGDQIVLVASSGIHTNGASLARRLARELPDGYRTRLPSGRLFGEAVLDPSVIYVPLVAKLLERDVPVTYLSHISGHGFRKIMRAHRALTYRINVLPPVPEILGFMIEKAGMDEREAYGTFNMGAGYAVFCGPGNGQAVVEAARSVGLHALIAGGIEEGPRQVILEPRDIAYASDELHLS